MAQPKVESRAIAGVQRDILVVEGLSLAPNGVEGNGGQILGLEEVLYVPVSFETGFQMTLKLFFPYAVTINKLRSIVTKALSGTDAGTITANNAASAAMATGVLTIPLSSALGVATSASPTSNNSIAADANMELVIAKTTAGGEALVTVEFTRA